MKRLNTINFEHNLELIDYEIPKEDVGPYVVDDSCFVPISEAVSQLTTNALGDTVVSSYFDFPDGKDTGISVPISRTKNGKDIAELSSHIMDSINDIADKKIKAENELKAQKDFESKIQAINKNTPKTE